MSACRPHALFYVPSTGGNYFFGVVYVLAAAAFVARYILAKQPRPHSTLLLVAGCTTYGVGFLMRPSMSMCNLDMNLYLAQTSVLAASPCFFLAFNWYMLRPILHRASYAPRLGTMLGAFGLFYALATFAVLVATGPAYMLPGISGHYTARDLSTAGTAMQLAYGLFFLVPLAGVHGMLSRSSKVTGVQRIFAALWASTILMLVSRPSAAEKLMS